MADDIPDEPEEEELTPNGEDDGGSLPGKEESFRIVFVRLGESIFNKYGLFTGWYDAVLTEKGINEARSAGHDLKMHHYRFDAVFTSVLERAKNTARHVLDVLGQHRIPVYESWRLNERHQGALIGCSKSDMSGKYGVQQVIEWRHSLTQIPPIMRPTHPYYDLIVNDPKYKKNGPLPHEFPMAESYEMLIRRLTPYWEDFVRPRVVAGKRSLIIIHTNVMRALVAVMEDAITYKLDSKKISPRGVPVYFDVDKNLKAISRMHFICRDKVAEIKIRQKMRKFTI